MESDISSFREQICSYKYIVIEGHTKFFYFFKTTAMFLCRVIELIYREKFNLHFRLFHLWNYHMRRTIFYISGLCF
jgi:hypothetical protein